MKSPNGPVVTVAPAFSAGSEPGLIASSKDTQAPDVANGGDDREPVRSAPGGAPPEIPDVVIARLPAYYRLLARLEAEGQTVISSSGLGGPLGVTSAQIRRDLSYFGRFGQRGRGYSVPGLTRELRTILGLDRRWKMVLVGAGQLGRAIAAYRGFAAQGFDLVALYDASAAVMGSCVAGHVVRDAGQLESDLLADPPDIGIVAVPAEYAQSVINTLVRAGVRAIVNYAPRSVRVPEGVQLRQVDPVASLHSMTYHLKGECS